MEQSSAQLKDALLKIKELESKLEMQESEASGMKTQLLHAKEQEKQASEKADKF